MKKRWLLILCIIVGLGNAAFAQETKTVTNAELEKFKQKRLQSEKDLRENYEKLGFPTPEELARQNAQRRADLEKLSNQLREEELQKQFAEAERLNAVRSQSDYWSGQNGYLTYSTGFDSYGYPSFGYFNYLPSRRGFLGYKSGLKLRFNYGGRNSLRGNIRLGGGYAFPSPFFNRPRGLTFSVRRR